LESNILKLMKFAPGRYAGELAQLTASRIARQVVGAAGDPRPLQREIDVTG
jgi:hypothetical protein